MDREIKSPSIFQALIPLFFLILFLSLNVYFFGDDTLGGANQIALIIAAAIGSIISVKLGHKWLDIRKQIIKSISSAMPSMLILMIIGSLAGTWLLSGVIPAMVYYGLQILHPSIFLVASVIICALVSVATGSSWSTVATIGIALLGIGTALGFNTGAIAGAIISGAYFGDKMSPLSDTTNLAPAMAGTDIFTHIRYMIYTTGPSILITIVIFLVMGFTFDAGTVQPDIEGTLAAIKENFFIHPVLFVVPVTLIVIIVRKSPPLPSLFAGTMLGVIFALVFQPQVIEQISGIDDNFAMASYIAVMRSMFGSIEVHTDHAQIADLFSTGGMAGMMNTIWLIITAMVFGGVMEAGGMLVKITKSIIRFAKSTGSLVATTAATCLFFNVTASDQYISIVVPGRMFAKTYRERDLKPEVLSRTLEDSGTVTSVLVPWNTCGATQAAVLGVPTLTFLPYAYFNMISPFMTMFMAAFNIKIRKISEDKKTANGNLDISEGKEE